MKKKKHTKLVRDYDKQKEKHLERLATKILDNDEKLNKLKAKNISTNFLDLFIRLKEIFDRIKHAPFFLKIDIEGSEYRILEEIIELQDFICGIVIEFHNIDLHEDKILSFINNF
jgi:FkbM family methyltransferase